MQLNMKNNMKKPKKKFLFLLLIVFIYLDWSICSFYRDEIILFIKIYNFEKVIKYKDDLDLLINEYHKSELPFTTTNNKRKDDTEIDTVTYKELNNYIVTDIFKKFKLSSIVNFEKQFNYIILIKKSHLELITFDRIIYGFYYSAEDQAANVWNGERFTEYEDLFQINTLDYKDKWYKTEKIIDNWWYFETRLATKGEMIRYHLN